MTVTEDYSNPINCPHCKILINTKIAFFYFENLKLKIPKNFAQKEITNLVLQ